MKDSFLGSTVAMVVGGLSSLGELRHWPNASDEVIIAGVTACCGALAYRSAKQRRLGLSANSLSRKISERLLVGVALLPVPLAAFLPEGILLRPWSAVVIPIWTVTAYVFVHRAKIEPPVLTLK
jgi:hypothetical protein